VQMIGLEIVTQYSTMKYSGRKQPHLWKNKSRKLFTYFVSRNSLENNAMEEVK